MATVTLDIPDALAEVAKRVGLLSPERLEEALRAQLKQDRIDAIWGVGNREVWPPLTDDEIMAEVQTEIDIVRAEKRATRS